MGILSTPGKKQVNQIVIEGEKILPDNLQWRAHGIRNGYQSFLHFANGAADLQLKLAITVAVAVGIRLLLPKKLERGTDVVPVLLKNEAHGCVIARLARFGGGFKLGQAQFVERLDLGRRMGIAIKMLLQLLEFVGGKKR